MFSGLAARAMYTSIRTHATAAQGLLQGGQQRHLAVIIGVAVVEAQPRVALHLHQGRPQLRQPFRRSRDPVPVATRGHAESAPCASAGFVSLQQAALHMPRVGIYQSSLTFSPG